MNRIHFVALPLVLAFAALPRIATAQCSYQVPPAPWPDSLAFDPPHPAAGEPFDVLVGGRAYYRLRSSSRNLAGASVVVNSVASSVGGIGTPPPPSLLQIPQGGLPNGTYTVRVNLLNDLTSIGFGIVDCAPISAQLVVGDGINAIATAPALGRNGLAVLSLLTAIAAAWAIRRRNPSARSR